MQTRFGVALGLLGAMLVGGVAFAGCGSDGQDESATPFSEVTSAPVSTTTSVASVSGAYTADVTDSLGYTYSVSVAAPTLSESIENASPGFTNIYLAGSVTVENTTAGRNAPFRQPGYGVILRLPEGSCSEWFDLGCERGSTAYDYSFQRVGMEAPVELQRSPELAVGESVTNEDTSAFLVGDLPESVDTDLFFWNIHFRDVTIDNGDCGGATICDYWGNPWYSSDGASIPEDVVQVIESLCPPATACN